MKVDITELQGCLKTLWDCGYTRNAREPGKTGESYSYDELEDMAEKLKLSPALLILMMIYSTDLETCPKIFLIFVRKQDKRYLRV